MNNDADSVEDLVLEYLASKGFAEAASALRDQLESSQPPTPSDTNFSTLESMLIRGRAAAASAAKAEAAPVLAPVPLPNGELPDPERLNEKVGRLSLGGATGPKPVRWHNPEHDVPEDDWTDDEALGYMQVAVSEETLLKGFAAAASRQAVTASAEERPQGPSRDPRDPIFETFEQPSVGSGASVASGAAPLKGAMADEDLAMDGDDEVWVACRCGSGCGGVCGRRGV